MAGGMAAMATTKGEVVLCNQPTTSRTCQLSLLHGTECIENQTHKLIASEPSERGETNKPTTHPPYAPFPPDFS